MRIEPLTMNIAPGRTIREKTSCRSTTERIDNKRKAQPVDRYYLLYFSELQSLIMSI